MEQLQAYNKALAALIVALTVWAAAEFAGVDVPAEIAVLATTVLVYLIPNRPQG